jgi:hypothetical protein
MNPSERESYIREHLTHLAADAFPDDVGPWHILEITHRGDHSAATFEEPPHAHPEASHRFKLVLSFGAKLSPETVGGYEFHNQTQKWHLLFGKDPMKQGRG